MGAQGRQSRDLGRHRTGQDHDAARMGPPVRRAQARRRPAGRMRADMPRSPQARPDRHLRENTRRDHRRRRMGHELRTRRIVPRRHVQRGRPGRGVDPQTIHRQDPHHADQPLQTGAPPSGMHRDPSAERPRGTHLAGRIPRTLHPTGDPRHVLHEQPRRGQGQRMAAEGTRPNRVHAMARPMGHRIAQTIRHRRQRRRIRTARTARGRRLRTIPGIRAGRAAVRLRHRRRGRTLARTPPRKAAGSSAPSAPTM